jgi:hypothetical protein
MPTATIVLSQVVIVVVSFAMRLPAASDTARSILDDRHARGAGRFGSISPFRRPGRYGCKARARARR